MFALRFPVFDILQGETRVEIEISPEELELEYREVEFSEPVRLDILFARFGSSITIRAKIITPVKLICARCLEKFNFELVSMVEEQIKLGRKAPAVADFADEDYAFIDENNGLIDLGQRIREEIILDVPRIPICKEDCSGIAYSIEHEETPEEPVDSRWEKLKNIDANNEKLKG
ncbi:MAG TPA: DUF177 domain-containing protein [candidate division Zixibacteria bacterium]|nr:DUF177 domain-containing protein [candidate division Zixibacteria bacterium]